MESEYNYQYLHDLLKSEATMSRYPLMVKAIAYAKVKTAKVNARILADLLRGDMIPECYIPDEKIRNLRVSKNKVHAELSKRWIDYSTIHDLFNGNGKEYLRSLKISGVKDCLDRIAGMKI